MNNTSLVERAISKIILINGTAPEEEMEQAFAKCISEVFGIEKTSIKNDFKSGSGSLYEYVSNTKKTYVDNQLSEYSTFPELTSYWTRGEKSCAVVPVMISGRIVSMVELLSKTENKFGTQLLEDVASAAYLIGLSVLYRKEESKSLRLANYFNSAFNAPTFQMLISNDGTIIRTNQEATLKFGNPIHGKINISSIFDADIKSVKEASKMGKEFITRSKSGSSVYAIQTSEVAPNMTYLHIRDATDEQRLSAIIDSMGQSYGAGIFLLRKDLTIAYSTPSIKKIIGYDSALTTSKKLVDLIPERERGKFSDVIADMEKTGRASGILGLVTDRGTISPIRFNISSTHTGYTMLFYDAGPERYIESIGSAFNEFLDGSTDLVLKVDELGYIRYSNQAAQSMLGYERAELMGKQIRNIVSDPTILERDLAFVRNGGKVDNSYTKLLAKENKQIDATNSVRLFNTANGSEYVIIAKELETRRRMKDQEEIMEKQERDIDKLKKTGELKSQFIYNISHELKTPLTSILGFSKLLNKGEFGEMNEEQREYLTTIINEAGRLMEIIGQVLDAAKLESDKMKLELTEVNLRELESSSSIKALSESAKNKGLEFTWHVEPEITSVIADHGRLIQVFVNLIGNSIKFTDKGGKIEVRISKKGRKIECSVIDTGIGISEENKHILFRKFYDAPKKGVYAKQEGSGTGLGLSITKQIIELHGGKIGYDPREGGGSRFWFVIPIKGKRKRTEK